MTINLFLPQVTRIPITGPEPYNTLVCVEGSTEGGPQIVTPGKLSRWGVTVPTTFKLAGFDQRVPPAFDHSTTAFMSSLGPAEDDTWLYAVDNVTGAGFNSVDGTYYVNIDVAAMPGDPADGTCIGWGTPEGGGFTECFYFFTIQVTSFVLCYEPPLPSQPGGTNPKRFPLATVLSSIRGQTRAEGIADRLSEKLGLPGSVIPALPAPGAAPGKPGKCRCRK